MNLSILFLASAAWGQQQAVLPVPDLKESSAQAGLQQTLDTKFSVYGGTVTGMISISTMQMVSKICWQDGTCQTTSGGNLVNGSTTTFAANAIVNLCGECGGVMIASTTLNQTFKATFTGINMSTRTYCMEYIFFTTSTNRGAQLWINDTNALQYQESDFIFGNAGLGTETTAVNSGYAISISRSAQDVLANTYTSGHVNIVPISSTTFRGYTKAQFESNLAPCGSPNQLCANNNHWLANLAAIGTRLDFCISSTAPTSLPNCLTPMHHGHAILCAAGFRTNP